MYRVGSIGKIKQDYFLRFSSYNNSLEQSQDLYLQSDPWPSMLLPLAKSPPFRELLPRTNFRIRSSHLDLCDLGCEGESMSAWST